MMTNVRGEPIVNYIAVSRARAFFLESVSTGKQGHVAQWLAGDITRVIEKNSNFDIVGAVTDNTSANKAAWMLLSQKYPQKFFYGAYYVFFYLRSYS